MVRLLSITISLAIIAIPLIAQQTENAAGLTLALFEEKLKNADDPQILDVRSPGEYGENHLKGATNFYVPDDEAFAREVTRIRKDKPVFVYSINNGRSQVVSARLVAAGFKEVYALPGGLANWIGAGNPIETKAGGGLTVAELGKLIPDGEVVLVDVGSKHCGGCKKLEPVVDEISRTQGVRVIKIELYDNRQLAKELNIEAVPTLILYKGKQSIWRKSGAISKTDIEDALDNSL